MHQKNVLVHALFRDPLRKPCRWFLPKIACFEPLKIQKIFIKISIINPKLYKYYNLQQILKIRWKTKLENPSKRATFAKNSPNSAHRLRISLNFISIKWSRPPRSGSRNRAWTHSKMIFFQITSNDKVSHFKIAYTCDTLHRSIQFQTWNLHKNAWNFMKLHRPTQFQTWHLHKNMKNCIARHNFKLENDVFSNENGGPGILEFCWQRRPSKCIKKTSWFMLYSGIRYVSLAGDFCSKLRVLNLQKIQKIFVKMSIIKPNFTNIAKFNRFWK